MRVEIKAKDGIIQKNWIRTENFDPKRMTKLDENIIDWIKKRKKSKKVK